jgi:hypothetical protein
MEGRSSRTGDGRLCLNLKRFGRARVWCKGRKEGKRRDLRHFRELRLEGSMVCPQRGTCIQGEVNQRA